MNQVQESMLESSIDQHSNVACVELYLCIYTIYVCAFRQEEWYLYIPVCGDRAYLRDERAKASIGSMHLVHKGSSGGKSCSR